MAPVGTGVLAVRNDAIGKLWSLSPSEESLEKDIRKFEQMGTRPLAPVLAINQAIDFHEWLGMERKLARLTYLREQLADQVLDLDRVIHYGSLDPAKAVAMLTIGFRNKSAIEASSWLATKHKIHVTTALRGGVDGIRISPNVFTSLEDVNRLATAVREFCK
jgi:selenocysteine lyase/cysteine desulfurase